MAGFELGRRLLHDSTDEVILARASEVAELARQVLDGLRRERAIVFVCDQRGRLIRQVQLSDGTANRSLIQVREVLNAVLRHDGAAFALAHNHPSGNSRPSQADIDVTVAIAAAAKSVDLRFVGHVIVAGDEWAEVKPAQQTPG